MKFIVAAAAAMGLLNISAQAQEGASGTFELDPTHTSVVFGVDHIGFSLYRGNLHGVSGTLEWDNDDPTQSSLTVEIEAPPAADGKFNEIIAKNALGADVQPIITFTSTEMRITGDETGVVVGDLSFNGQTHPVEMQVEVLRIHPQRLGFFGEVTFDRTEWGSDAWTDGGVGAEVIIEVNAEFGLAQ